MSCLIKIVNLGIPINEAMALPQIVADQLSALIELDEINQDIRLSNATGIGFDGSSQTHDSAISHRRSQLSSILNFPL